MYKRKVKNCTRRWIKRHSSSTAGRRKLAANKYSLHSFRHSFVSFCANSGVPLAIVSEIVGHGNPAMTRHYSHISNESKQDAIATLPQIESSSAVKASAPIITQITDKLNALSPAQ
ncbi:MAG: tyrosine-type recombinase/integrase [Victivallaceae bacterium]|nr:tyrosine-type recombinase/integrase [Victivallaceae bacterium]